MMNHSCDASQEGLGFSSEFPAGMYKSVSKG